MGRRIQTLIDGERAVVVAFAGVDGIEAGEREGKSVAVEAAAVVVEREEQQDPERVETSGQVARVDHTDGIRPHELKEHREGTALEVGS
jgi:hypothetical protein